MHVTTLRAYSSLRRRKRSAIVANTTLELIVSEDILGSIYGDDGNNLARLRQVIICLPTIERKNRRIRNCLVLSN